MVYDRHQLAGLRWRVLGASLAAWAVMLAVPAWSGDGLPASLCSSATAGPTWLTPDWLVRLTDWLAYNGYAVVTKRATVFQRRVVDEFGAPRWTSALASSSAKASGSGDRPTRRPR